MGSFRLVFALFVAASSLGATPKPSADLSLLANAEERAWVREHPVVRIQMSRGNRPFEYREDGVDRGMAYDLFLEACGRLGLSVEVTDLDWSQALQGMAMKDKPLDVILAISPSAERARVMRFTRPYLSFPQVIFTRRGHPFVAGIKDLAKDTIAVERDFQMEGWLRRDRPGGALLEVTGTAQALEALATGRASAYIGNLASVTYLIDRLGLVNIKAAAPSAYGDEPLALGVRLDEPLLAQLLQRALDSMGDQEVQAIRDRYLRLRYEHGLRPRDLVLWIMAVLAAAALFIVQLRRMVAQRTRELAAEVERRGATEQELRRTLKEQEKLRRQLADILEFLPDPTLVLDIQHRVQAWNLAMEQLTGVPKDQMLGEGGYAYAEPFYGKPRPLLADVVLDRAIPPHELYGQISEDQGVLSAQAFLPALRHGRGAWVSVSASALVDGEGRMVGAIETVRDITDRKAMEAQLAQAQRLEAIGTLAGGIAHDFNNILTAVGGYAELALSRHPGPELESDLRAITQATARATELVRQILAFSRVRPESPRLLDPAPVVMEALKMLRATVPATVLFEAQLLSRRQVMADPAELHRLVVNLCSNAALAVRGHGNLKVRLEDADPDAELRARVAGLRAGPAVVLTVADDGPGMAPEVLARIFEPFFTTRGDGGGTGMGLAVVHGIVQARGGAVQVDSSPGHGSSFRVFLPAADAPGQAAPEGAAPLPATGRGRLLLVDDEPMIVDLLTQTLGRRGYQVTPCGGGPEALELFLKDPDRFDLVVTDRTMPGLTGLELAARVKASRPSLPVILCTGYDEEDHGVRDAAVDLVVAKPVTAAALAAHIQRMLA